MPDRRLADTKVAPDGRRVPASDFEDAEGPGRSTVIDPATQIAADGTRVATEQIDPAQSAGRNAESLFREQRGQEIAAGVRPPANGTGISNDVETSGSAKADDEPASEDAGDEPADEFESMNKAELLDEAADLDIDGRSSMNKAELLDAVRAAHK